MNRKEKVAVYIDGGNTYRRLKEMGIPEKSSRFDYSTLVKHLVGERELVSKRYYVGIIKNFDGSAKGEQMVKSQQTFLNGLTEQGFGASPSLGLIKESSVPRVFSKADLVQFQQTKESK